MRDYGISSSKNQMRQVDMELIVRVYESIG